jgi:signal transduction histidine kinase
MERAVLQGLAVFRWLAWGWMVTVLVLSRHDLDRPLIATALIGLALVVTALWSMAWKVSPGALLEPRAIAVELAVGAALVLCDGWVYESGHAFSTSERLGSIWALVAILSAGVAKGRRAGLAAGLFLGACRFGGTLINDATLDDAGHVLSLVNTAVLYGGAGYLAGYLYRLLAEAERQVSAARAREEFARTLHDGVLQTLALVERRAGDPALARLAREQERELREFLFGGPAGSLSAGQGSDLGSALRVAAARFEDRYGGRVQVLVADDLPPLSRSQVEAIAGAVGEALANAGKHGDASGVIVYAEPDGDEGVFCSVKDDGRGFDAATTADGVGISRSIRARMSELGGRAEIVTAPGFGTEVRLWLA